MAKNGFHLNGDFKNKGYSSFHYRPFTLEALFGFCDALQETLLQDHQGYIHVFPALSAAEKKKNVSFRRLRCSGGVLIDATAAKGILTEVTISAKKEIEIKLKNTFVGEIETIYRGKNVNYLLENDFLVFRLKKGKTKLRLLQALRGEKAHKDVAYRIKNQSGGK